MVAFGQQTQCLPQLLEAGQQIVDMTATINGWARTVKLPATEKAIGLFNGRDLSGWDGQTSRYFSVVDGAIRAASIDLLPTSTYLFTKGTYRNFRLLFEIVQTRSARHSTTHSAIAALGRRITVGSDRYGFRGPLLMVCGDWGVWDALRRNRVDPPQHEGSWRWSGERLGEWNQIEVLVIGNRIRMVANGCLVMDYVDDATMLEASPIGLQLHANDRPQEFHFRGLVVVREPFNILGSRLTRPPSRCCVAMNAE